MGPFLSIAAIDFAPLQAWQGAAECLCRHLVSESALRRPVEAPRIAWTALKTLAKGGMVVADREILRTALYTFVSHTLATKPLQQRIPTL